MDALVHLYPKVSPGGYVIVDDYGCFEACAKSVHDFRDKFGIDAEIKIIDWTGVYWQKPADETAGAPSQPDSVLSSAGSRKGSES